MRGQATTACTSAVYQSVHACLEVYKPLSGYYVTEGCNSSPGNIFTKSRSLVVNVPCKNTLSTRYNWKMYTWVTVFVDGKNYTSDTLYTPAAALFCAP